MMKIKINLCGRNDDLGGGVAGAKQQGFLGSPRWPVGKQKTQGFQPGFKSLRGAALDFFVAFFIKEKSKRRTFLLYFLGKLKLEKK